ncbi:hypothetical protein PGT21_006044 [Puccinia graminis f. sp. tritici]|uniref:Uncharacterized protein n=1 Tax=Puccinia graminis f. sp. tritici TaxID=56615 RepID=A0A5B0SMH1_PUCGR|nr:hypothetical protein PGT21_006044 [Puccinia graminis f. sp. tritici]KAA1137764.1 hypothetical protein PGTUg99_014154 [Puccinia graminis f. sp. tritici]
MLLKSLRRKGAVHLVHHQLLRPPTWCELSSDSQLQITRCGKPILNKRPTKSKPQAQ